MSSASKFCDKNRCPPSAPVDAPSNGSRSNWEKFRAWVKNYGTFNFITLVLSIVAAIVIVSGGMYVVYGHVQKLKKESIRNMASLARQDVLDERELSQRRL